MESQFSFEKLTIYQRSRQLVCDVYRLVNQLPPEERFCLGSQIRRAITSVPSNLAESSGRVSEKEQSHFYEIAYGSLMEAYCQLQLCVDLGYIAEEDLDDLKNLFWECSRMLTALRYSANSTPIRKI